MNRAILFLAMACVMVCLPPGTANADAKATEGDKPNASPSLTVAILDFDSSTAANPNLGKQISEVLTATLSGQAGFTLVDRASLSRILQEHELNLTGLVDTRQSTTIGKLVGAKILVTGKIFPVDKQLFLTAKLIGTETTVVRGVLVKGDNDQNVGDLMMQLSDQVAKRLREAGPELVAQNDALDDPLPALKKKLAGRKLPKIAIRIQEHHVAAGPAVRVDPAVETELAIILKDAGFTIIDGDDKALADGGVTVIVGGEAFSEFAARIASLVSCSARVEIKITDRKTNEVLYSDRETTRGVDLAENAAAKTALQKAGRVLAIRILQHFDETSAPDKTKPRK